MRIIFNLITANLLIIGGTSACSASPSENIVDIKNVKSGLVCLYKYEQDARYTPDPHVCFQTEDIYITGQGQCVFDGKSKPCTWYGYEFEYHNKSNLPVTMICEFSSDADSIVGNPDGVWDESISSYEVSLDPGEGYFSNPQYTIYDPGLRKNPKRNVTRCSIQNKQVFEVKYDLHMPIRP